MRRFRLIAGIGPTPARRRVSRRRRRLARLDALEARRPAAGPLPGQCGRPESRERSSEQPQRLIPSNREVF